MNNTIIAVYGSANKGKSDSIKRACKLILESYPNAVSDIKSEGGDILLTISIGDIKIGFESQGDPNCRII